MAGKPVKTELIKDPRYIGSILSEMEMGVAACDYEQPLKTFLPELEKAHAQSFQAQTDPAGNPLKPLAPSTIARKGHNRILFETGRLEKSLAGTSGDSVRATTHRGLLFGTEVPYSIFHQDGLGVPQREHVGTTEEMVNKMVDAVIDQTIEAMKA